MAIVAYAKTISIESHLDRTEFTLDIILHHRCVSLAPQYSQNFFFVHNPSSQTDVRKVRDLPWKEDH
jgi:hypothetical protein